MDFRTGKSSGENHRSIAIIISLCLLSIWTQISYGYALSRENEDGIKIFYKLAPSSCALLVSNDDINHTFYSGEVKIPESVKIENYEYQVVGIANEAFKGSVLLTSVIMNSKIESIGDNAFEGCHSLNKIIFSPMVSAFGKFCFNDCPSLSFLDFSQCFALTRFSDHQFEGATGLERIVFPPNLEHIGTQAFSKCTSLKEFNCPSTVKSIGSGIFIGCAELSRIDLSNSNITAIPDGAFQQISNLTDIVLPKDLNSLGELCFLGSEKVSVVVPASVKSIGDICFLSCKKVYFVHSNFKIHHALGTGNYYFLDPNPPTFVNYDSDYDSQRNVNIYVADKSKWSFFTNKDVLKEIFSLPSETFTYDGLSHFCTINEGIDYIKLTSTSNEAKSVGNYNWRVEYLFADDNNQYAYIFNYDFEIQGASLNVSVKDCSRRYGDANPRFEFIYSGLIEGEEAASVLSKLPVATCSARANSQIGYYDIEVSGAESANYEITYTPGILTVEKAPLTIRPKDVSRVYGQPDPEFEISYMGFKNNEDESVLFRAPQVTTTATVKSPTGQYPITASGASAQNYEIEYEEGILTITKNILKVIVNDASKLYGDTNPQFTVRYEGLLSGDTENVVTTKPQFYTEATVKSNAGVYDVTASGAISPNYDLEYQSGNLTVKPRGISAKVGNYNKTYGADNPEFVVEYVGLVNGDDKTAITEPSTVTCEAGKNSNVGTYAITVTGGRGQNYEVTSFTNGTLTIEKANQIIEWNQDLSSVNQYNQIELIATSSSGLPVTYDVASNNVVDIYTSGGKTYLDCYGTGTVTIRATQLGNENYNPSETITNRLTVVSEGGYVDPSTPNISINVTTAGTLSSKIAESKKYQIKSLTVTGNLNGTDIRYLREMAGRDVNGTKTNGILEKLDLSRATIVSGGDYYYTTNPSSSYNSYKKYTSNNQISDYMFYGCSTLTNLTLPQNSTAIGAHAFDGCINLSNISMSERIQTIGENAFNGNISLTRISIPDQTTSIGNYAFQGCSGLTTLILSSSVKTIGNGMLNGCINIQEISLNSDNTYYSTLNGVLYNKTQTSLIIYPAGKQLQTFEIPDGVTEIKSSGFYGTKALEYLFLPESLTTIGADAFKGCSNLVKLVARPITPAECANDCFEAVSKSNCTLYVPRGSHNGYWAAPVWGDFLKIEESNDLSVGGNIAKPDYGFEFPETILSRGKCTYLPVSMNNVDPVVAFNCDIVLPEGVKLYEDASGQIVFKTSDRFPVSQMIDSRVQTNGDVRIICTSSSNEAFNGTDGILFYIPLFITDPNASQDSEYQLTVKNIEFTRKDQSGYHAVESPDITVTLTVSEYSLGDANGDGRITGVDAVIAKGYFLGDNPSNFIFKAADMNFDDKISSTDVVLITDEFLSQNQRLMAKTASLCGTNGSIDIVGTHNSSPFVSFDISLSEAYRYTAVQMDVTIPEGFNIKNINVGEGNRASHNVRYHHHANGMIRLFISSDNNEDFGSDNILTIELEGTGYVNGSDKIVVEDILAVQISGRDYLETAVEGSSVPLTDISWIFSPATDGQIEVWTENSALYIKSDSDSVVNLHDIAGRFRSIEIHAGITSIPLPQGVYLINNKKILIK